MPDLSGALYVPEFETLIISDLHLEQGSSLSRRGVHVPPFDTVMTLHLLQNILSTSAAKRLVFLGDSFHDHQGEARLDESHRKILRKLAQDFETIWITGNHDPEPPQNLGGRGAAIDHLGPISLRHEPSAKLEGSFEIAGHLHPGCGINQRGRRIYGKCFVSDDTRVILPAFGAYTGGLSVTSKAFDGLLNENAAQALMIGRAALHRFAMKKIRST